MREFYCSKCGELLPEDNFYTFFSKRQNQSIVHSRCKPCHIASIKSTYVKKGTGFALLSRENQDKIVLGLANRNVKIKKLAEDVGVKYATLLYWMRKGQVPVLEPVEA